MLSTTLPLLLLAATRSVYAAGCATHTYGHCEDGITHWYDPDDYQICDPLDCGGGRAPPKYNVPCCAAYTGTEACVQTPSYMSCLVAQATATATDEGYGMTDVYQTPEGTAGTTVTQAPVAIITSSFPVSPMPTTTEAPATSSSTTQTAATTAVTSSGGSSSSSGGAATPTTSNVPVATNAAGRSRYELVAVAGAAVAGVLVVV